MCLEQGGFVRTDVVVTNSADVGLQFTPGGIVQRVQVGAVEGHSDDERKSENANGTNNACMVTFETVLSLADRSRGSY